MNFSDLQTRTQALVSFEGWTDTTVAPNYPNLVNQGWQEFSWEAECLIASETQMSVAGQSQYNLQNSYKELLEVVLDGKPLLRSTELIERQIRPDWVVQPAGTPRYWTFSNYNPLILSPPPASAVRLFARGVVQGSPMVLTTDQPGQVNGAGSAIPARYHEAVALRAAVLWGELYALETGQARLERYQAQYLKYVADAKRDISKGYQRATEQST